MKTYDERTQSVLDMVARKKRTHRAVVAAVTSSCVCVVVLVLSLVLFLPFAAPGDGNPYGAVISAMSYDAPHNNWQRLRQSISEMSLYSRKSYAVDDGAYNAVDKAIPNGAYGDVVEESGVRSELSAARSDDSEHYVENTNLQVADVREGDVLKESTHYFYLLRRICSGQDPYEENGPRDALRLVVYRKEGLDTRAVATFDHVLATATNYIGEYEMYLNDACDTLTIVCDNGFYGPYSRTAILQVDVSDLTDIHVLRELCVTGQYLQSRVIDGRLLLATSYHLYSDDWDYDDYASFVPYVQAGEQIALVEPQNILCPPCVSDVCYTVLTLFDAGLSQLGQVAMLGYDTDALYVNNARAYVAGVNVRYYEEDRLGDTTDIACVSIGAQGLSIVDKIEVYGRVGNQYWMDEYQDVLRVACTVRDYQNVQSTVGIYTEGNNASLYCYRVGTWELVGSVERFAPEGESVQSARFVGTKAYVCTAEIRYFTDPVYCFDLSDYAHITHTDTGAIDGYSTSLIPFADDTLLGIGVQDSRTVKVELYRETADAVQSVDAITLGGDVYRNQVRVGYCYYYPISVYKSYLLDAEDGLFGVACWVDCADYDQQAQGAEVWSYRAYYLLFTYRDGVLRLAQAVLLDDGADAYARAAVADGYVYLFGYEDCHVVSVAELLAVGDQPAAADREQQSAQ